MTEGIAAATPDARATAVAERLLHDGANALEAAVAAGAMLCACYPHMTGLGGDALMLVCEADGRVRVLSGIGQAAMLAPEFQRRDGKAMRGPGSATTAAALVDAFGEAWLYSRSAWDGRQSWADLLRPATSALEQGVAVGAHQRFWHEAHRSLLRDIPGFAATFESGGSVPEAGDVMANEALARTFRTLARDGHRSFYEGPLAEAVASDLEAAGSPLRVGDLAACRARWETPLEQSWGDGELVTTPPPTQGAITQLIVGCLADRGLDDVPEGSGTYYHRLIEAVKLGMSARQRWLADPVFAPASVCALLSESTRGYARRIDDTAALPWPSDLRDGDTAWSGFRDAEGRSVSLIQSIFMDFGSGLVLPDTGILWHNRGAGFSPRDDHPNALWGGKRPMHTLNPFAYRRNGRVELVFGTQGGDGQPQTLAALITRMLHYGMPPGEAIARPRFMLGHGPEDSRDSVKIESDVGEAVVAELIDRGQWVETVKPHDPLMGLSGAVGLFNNELVAHHDPRGGGAAFADRG